MEYLQIPLPSFSSESIVKYKADEIIKVYINTGNIVAPYLAQKGKIEQVVEEQLYKFSNSSDRIFFINYIILHVAKIKSQYDNQIVLNLRDINVQQLKLKEHEAKLLLFDNISFFLYDKLYELGVKINDDAFTYEESNTLDSKINDIIDALNRLQAGQEVLYEQFEEVKEQLKADFESLKTDKPLGKKRFFKVALGTIGSYTGNKVADEIFTQLRPYIADLLTRQAPHLLEGFIKMIG